MPAVVVRFSDVGNRPPRRVFIDTSFIQALIVWAKNPDDARGAAAHKFYDLSWRSNAAMWTTPFTAEEILWNYMREELFTAMAPFNLRSIGEFKRTRRDDYAQTLVGCKPHLEKMVGALSRLKIAFEFPGERAQIRSQWGRAVWLKAWEILGQCAIEASDAFHIACAVVDGTSHIASLDDGFKEVEGLTVYCYT